MERAKKRWPTGRGIRISPKMKRLRVKVRGIIRLLMNLCCRRRPLVREDRLYYTPLHQSNSFYAEAIADCIDFIKRSST